jgi:hypothetical protein
LDLGKESLLIITLDDNDAIEIYFCYFVSLIKIERKKKLIKQIQIIYTRESATVCTLMRVEKRKNKYCMKLIEKKKLCA